jgi:hypothetical protein
MSSGDSGLVLVMVMSGVFCMVSSIGLGYTCTGGSFDSDDFDMDKCLEWPKKSASTSNTTPTSTTTPGGGGPSVFTPSSDFNACEAQFFNEATTTCYSSQSGTAGIRWKWLDNEEADKCIEKTTKYDVVVSSSSSNHNVRYRFPAVIGRDANSFAFTNAPSGFLESQNIRFYITPLNDIDEQITRPATYELDTQNSSEVCNAHGTPVDFGMATSLGAVGSQPSLNPTPCQGNTYTPPSACTRNGVVLDGTPDKCGDGLISWNLDTSAADYVAAKDGGACVLAHTRGCTVPCPPDAPPPPDCNSYVTDFLRNDTLGCVKDDFDHSNPPANASSYTKYTGGHYPVGEDDGVMQYYKIATDPLNCPKLTEWRACGYTETPVNCVGSWVKDGGEYYKNKVCDGCSCKSAAHYRQKYKYVIPEGKEGNATGAACDAVNGATKDVWSRGCGSSVCCKCCH